MRDFTEEEFEVQLSKVIETLDAVINISLNDEGYIDVNHYFTQVLSMVSVLLVESIHTVSSPDMGKLELMEQNRHLYSELLKTLNESECPFPDYGEVH